MQETSDTELLRQYLDEHREEAFAALVTRHITLVYSAALRKTGHAQAAEEVVQAVFILLAQKAQGLRQRAVLSGWLYQTARFAAASFLRTEIRRARREEEACMQSLSHETEPDVWPQIQPLLEDAMGRLGEKERDAIVLRFFEGKSFQEIGVAVGASENAAKKRVSHGLDKLRKFFSKRGVVSTTALIAGAMDAHSVQAAPVVLVKSVSAVAIAKGSIATASTLTLVKGTMKLMTWLKIKTAVAIGATVVLATGTAIVATKAVAQSGNGSSSFRQKLVGTWVFSTTNTPGDQRTNTITKEFQYHADGTFDMTGEVVQMAPTNTRPGTSSMFVNGANGTSVTTEVIEYPYRRQIGGSGIWRVEQGYFYSTFTKNTGAWRVESGTRTYIVTNLDNRVSFFTRPTGMENKEEIISITGQDFTTRDRLGQVQTATRKQ